MSACHRRIILIFLVLLLFFESVVGEIHRAKPTWSSKNVAGGGSNHHHLHSQHHRSHLKYSAGSNNVAPSSSTNNKNDEGSKEGEEEDGGSLGLGGSGRSPPRMSPQATSGQEDEDGGHHHHIDGDDRTGNVGKSASLFPSSDIDKERDDDDDRGRGTGGGKGESIADRFCQQPADINTWIFTMISASFVGLSGVLPLVVIPLETGKSLRQGDGYNQLKLFLSFAVGGLLGDVFLHLLPEAWNHVSTSEDFMWIGGWVLTGILSFLFIEKVMGETDTESEQDVIAEGQNQTNTTECIKISGYLNLFANCIDNFTHGLAIAGSYLVSRKVGIITTIAILLHEIPHEIGDFAILLRAGFDRWKAAKAQLLTATGGLLGAITALTAESAEEAGIKTAWILPFTAGGFIYIAMVTIVPELVKEEKPKQSLHQIVCICAGIACMLLVTLVFE